MTDGERTILREIQGLRTYVENSIERVHVRIDGTNEEVSKVKEIALVNKTKVGTFVAGMAFVFTGLINVVLYYFKPHR